MKNSDQEKSNFDETSPEMESEKSEDAVTALLETFETSLMVALPSQNLQLAEESHTKAFAISEFLKSQYKNEKNPDDLIYLDFADIIYFQVAMVKGFLNFIFLSAEKRLDKAKICLSEIKDYSEKSTGIYQNLSGTEISSNNDLNSILNVCALNAKFFKSIITFQSSSLDLQLRLGEGKYVDEIQERKKAISLLRKYFEEPWVDYNNEIYLMHCAMIRRIIDIQERHLETLKKELNKVNYIRPKGNHVFVIHGHDEAILLELKLMLKETFSINPIILKDEADDGSTIIEKFEKYAIKTSFVFALFTPDDFVSNNSKDYYQGRPNVLFELGWFFGRLGRDKVRILRKKNTILPSDLAGIITIDYNDRLEEVFRKINSSLESAGIVEKN